MVNNNLHHHNMLLFINFYQNFTDKFLFFINNFLHFFINNFLNFIIYYNLY